MLTFPAEPSREVLILGAGFSKALSEAMPLTDDLGNRVLALVTANSDLRMGHHFQNGQFEAWLSRLADDQPDLTVAENLENRACFARCSGALASVLNDSVEAGEAEALGRTWLPTLLSTLHARLATVITFNQDVLLELAVDQASLYGWDQARWDPMRPQPKVQWHDILDGQPPTTGSWSSDIPQPTFRLLKLHGSTNWFWRPGDVSGATTARWFLPGRVPAHEALPNEEAALRRALPGRSPLIVPPAAAKSGYYRTPILTQLWQDARKALSRARVHVSLVGYSIPPTDLVTSGMLRDTLLQQRVDAADVTLDIVNPKHAMVKRNLRAIGLGRVPGRSIDSVEDFVCQYVVRAATELLAGIRTQTAGDPLIESDCLLLVGPCVAHGRKVIGLESTQSGELELVLEDAPQLHAGTNVALPGSPAPLPLEQLLRHVLADPSRRLLKAVWPTGERQYIVGAVPYQTNTGAGNGHWQVLITAP